MISLARNRRKHKHPTCPYKSDDPRYAKWYYKNVIKPKREKQKRRKK